MHGGNYRSWPLGVLLANVILIIKIRSIDNRYFQVYGRCNSISAVVAVRPFITTSTTGRKL